MSRSTPVAINGFGRMGRLALRAGWGRGALEFVAVNDPAMTAEMAAHLLKFDSVHGRWSPDVRAVDGGLEIDGRRVAFSSEADLEVVARAKHGARVVLECSGKFRTPQTLAPYFDAGVPKVVVSAPVKEGALNIVMGVNDRDYDPAVHHLVTAASCTTNCLAPVVKVLQEGLGIRHGVITTIHDVTNTQRIVDAAHTDFRRARSALLSMIPTTTGSATAITAIFPQLRGKLSGLAVRVPLLNASLTDCVFEVERPTTVEEVNDLLQAAAIGPLEGILGFEERPLVSIDFRDDPRSGIVDGPSTMVIDGTQVKLLVWYDSEFGYAQRLVDLTQLVARSLPPS